MNLIEKLFRLHDNKTNRRTEVLAGFTTFLTMAYITVVNPAILSRTGMDFGAVFVATCLAAAFGSILMGVLGNYPVALAPGMGQNAFFTYSVVITGGYSWQAALGAVFISGIIFIIISILPLREWAINSIPRSLKMGISSGVGLFLGFIALKNAGVVVENKATLVGLGDLTAYAPICFLVGFMLIAALHARRIPGAVIIGILLTTAVGWSFGFADFRGIASLPPSPMPVALQLDIAGALNLSMVTIILSFLLVDVFDTAGTLIGVATRAGIIGKDGRLPHLGGALLADSGATAFGALAGTSSTTSYIESAAGVEAGGRTGLTAVVTGLLFLGCLFFAPLAQSIPAYATAAALLFVCCLMAHGLTLLDWDDHTESIPAVITALAMPLSFSIANGIGIGFITYAGIKILAGQARACPGAVYVIALIFLLKFAFLG